MPGCRWEDILGFLIYKGVFPPHGPHGKRGVDGRGFLDGGFSRQRPKGVAVLVVVVIGTASLLTSWAPETTSGNAISLKGGKYP